MSDHTLCDKCSKSIDKSQPYIQVAVTEVVEAEGTPTTQTPTVTYDYHPAHAPKFETGKPEEPVVPEEPA